MRNWLAKHIRNPESRPVEGNFRSRPDPQAWVQAMVQGRPNPPFKDFQLSKLGQLRIMSLTSSQLIRGFNYICKIPLHQRPN